MVSALSPCRLGPKNFTSRSVVYLYPSVQLVRISDALHQVVRMHAYHSIELTDNGEEAAPDRSEAAGEARSVHRRGAQNPQKATCGKRPKAARDAVSA
jgi:hypothetical protein